MFKALAMIACLASSVFVVSNVSAERYRPATPANSAREPDAAKGVYVAHGPRSHPSIFVFDRRAGSARN